MQIKIKGNKFGQNIPKLVRKIGYVPIRDRKTGEVRYIRRLRRGFYPRFHAHPFLDQNNHLIIDLHYDNAKPLHRPGTSRVEKEGEVLEKEAKRIQELLK